MKNEVALKDGRKVIIKHASHEDVDGVWKNFDDVIDEAIYLPIFEKVNEYEKESWYEDIKFGRELCIVAKIPRVKSPDNIAGQCEITNSEWEASNHVGVLGIIVKEDYRGIGLGGVLIDCAIRESRKLKEKKKIMLSCFSTNEIALNLYKKFGFQELGIRKNQFFMNDQYYDEVMMELFIDDYLKNKK